MGELLDPALPTVAAAQAAGLVGHEHLEVINRFFSKLPDAIDYQTREEAEKDLGRLATEFGPAELRKAADRLAYVLNQDGPVPTDADLARQRYFAVGKQQADGMTQSADCSTPRASRLWMPSWPSGRHPACAILMTRSPALMGNRQRRPRKPICEPNPNAITMHSRQWAVRR